MSAIDYAARVRMPDGRTVCAHRETTHHATRAMAKEAARRQSASGRYPPGARFTVEQRSANRWTVVMDARPEKEPRT